MDEKNYFWNTYYHDNTAVNHVNDMKEDWNMELYNMSLNENRDNEFKNMEQPEEETITKEEVMDRFNAILEMPDTIEGGITSALDVGIEIFSSILEEMLESDDDSIEAFHGLMSFVIDIYDGAVSANRDNKRAAAVGFVYGLIDAFHTMKEETEEKEDDGDEPTGEA